MEFQVFDLLFSPKSLAIIGASPKEGSLGRALMENIIKGGYEGKLFPVNPKYSEILGFPCYSNSSHLPFSPDVGIICTPAAYVPTIIEDLGEKGIKAAVVISAGFAEGDHLEGRHLQEKMLDAARRWGVRIVGPNCLGIINTKESLNATFSPLALKKGNIAFVSQSGAVLVSLLERAHTMGIGFSKVVSVGDLSDLNFADCLEYLMEDKQTEAILLYVEALTDAGRFLRAVKKAVMTKPVIVVKSGRFQAAAQAVRSHSGALAGSDAVYEAAFRQAGLYRLYDLQDVYDLLLALTHFPKLKGDHLTILTNGGGVGILAADELISLGGKLGTIPPSTFAKLNAVLPSTWSQGNPIDIIGDASSKRYAASLNILMDDPAIHTILLMHCPTSLSPSKGVFEAVIDTLDKRKGRRPDLFLVSPQQDNEKRIFAHFNRHHIPIYPTPERAARAFMHLLNCENEKCFIDKNPGKPLKADEKVTKLLKHLVENKEQEWVDHHIIQEILSAYGIPVVKTEMASSPGEAKVVSQRLGFPLVLKIASKDIIHKSDVGGVVLNLTSPEDVEKRAKEMLSTVSSQNPMARIDGFILQPMIPLDHGFELFLGAIRDKTFGPVVIFGAGGKAVEVINDKSLALAPLSSQSALQLIQKTKIYQQIRGYRDQAPVPIDQLIDSLIKFSSILVNHPEIVELDINPLLTDSKRILVLDTRMRLLLNRCEQG